MKLRDVCLANSASYQTGEHRQKLRQKLRKMLEKSKSKRAA